MYVDEKEQLLAELSNIVVTDRRVYHNNELNKKGVTTIDLRSVSSVEYGITKKWVFIFLAVLFAFLPLISLFVPAVSFIITGAAAGVLFLIFLIVFFATIETTLVITYDSKSFKTVQKGVSQNQILQIRNAVFKAKDAVLKADLSAAAPSLPPPAPVYKNPAVRPQVYTPPSENGPSVYRP